MHLVQLLLPLYDNDGHQFKRAVFDQVRHELTERFGGVTVYLRAPAEGLWKEESGEVARDDVVIYEVMTESLERAWWATYREELARRFRQQEMLVRSTTVERL